MPGADYIDCNIVTKGEFCGVGRAAVLGRLRTDTRRVLGYW